MKLRFPLVFLQVTTVALLLGCDEDSTMAPPVPVQDSKAEVTAAHIARLADFLAERADAFAASLAPGAIDLGGGPTGTGRLPPEYFTAEYWQAFMSSTQFDPYRGKEVNDLVDPASTQAVTKVETEAMFGPNFGAPRFTLMDGDMVVLTPGKSGSQLDAWFGVYRKIDGKWLVVALD